MILTGKVAVIYGAGGAIGGAIARAFAAEGARVFLTGHSRVAVEAVANDIGKAAEAAEVDALDEQAIDKHLQFVIDSAGRVDISFNAVGIPGKKFLGTPLAEIDVKQFSLPVTTYVTSYFLTARLAARRMLPNKSGIIMTVSALPARMGFPMNGGYGPAQAAKEALTRDLSVEFARQGLRVVCTTRHSGDKHDEGSLRDQRQASRYGLGAVHRLSRKHDPSQTMHDARRGSQRGSLRGFGQGDWVDRNDHQFDYGKPG